MITLVKRGIRFISLAVLITSLIVMAAPAKAEISKLTLNRRSCAGVTAFVVYDGYVEGAAPYYVAFAADVNANGIFGEAGESLVYSRILGNLGSAAPVSGRMTFTAQAEGTVISVIAYVVDSAGKSLSEQLGPISYTCTFKPALDSLPATGSSTVSSSAVTAVVTSAAVTVYSEPTVKSTVVGGIGKGQRVTVYALNVRGDWAQVQYSGGTGWILWRGNAFLYGPRQNLPRLANAE
ncbi:MAG: SH3 domain-containing protein [Anaerolineae bacterium]|nr:SH3 domain-containing protein [Anaerolineae bacterium]